MKEHEFRSCGEIILKMNCVIPGVNIKVFGRAVHSLSRIGEELYVEPLEHGLALRTVNSSRSAYACFLFAPSFFQHYDDGSGQTINGSGKEEEEGEEESIRCKIAMKSCLTVFKSVYTLEKTVERCKIKLDMNESRLIFQLHCRHGIVKTHNLAFIECETLQAVFSKDMCPNSLRASARLLCDAVQNFQNNQEEVTLIVKPDKILLKNYVEDEPDPTKVVHTELRLEPEEFDNIQVGVDSEVTFCLKEMRAILAFAEATNLPISLKFETAGRPIVFSIDSDSAFEANFVLATLADTMTQQRVSSQAESKTSQKRKYTSNSRPSVKASNKSQNSRKESDSMHVGRANKTEEQSARINEHEESRRKPNNKSPDEQGRSNRLNAALSELMNDDMDDVMLDQETREEISKQPIPPASGATSVSGRDNETDRITTGSPVPSTSRENVSPLIPLQSSKPQIFNITTEDIEMKENEEEEEEELVPGTPPSKRFRSMFFGSQASTITQSSQKALTKELSVLAEDTDDEG
ncbi:hypothetical protein CHS0354_019970 [Potamilus streckersoni]|uniref:Cell cycle checkpoint control protein RAD9A n=1 Tax=Potamilus streckersoni TaxID=2493646 RepID=A0AAE0VN89_9BIVA|nr:hypothetical protein CHS0354_019970 [Potamilus streckersoni]